MDGLGDSPQTRSPKRRARRASGFAVRAEFEARRFVESNHRLPTTTELRQLVGGGSQRDLARARDHAKELLPVAASESTVDEIRRLKEQVQHYKDLAESASTLADERVRGLERHLLMETARIRDELEQKARTKSPFGTIVTTIEREPDPLEEKIYE